LYFDPESDLPVPALPVIELEVALATDTDELERLPPGKPGSPSWGVVVLASGGGPVAAAVLFGSPPMVLLLMLLPTGRNVFPWPHAPGTPGTLPSPMPGGVPAGVPCDSGQLGSYLAISSTDWKRSEL
jgi:hypothetical protein